MFYVKIKPQLENDPVQGFGDRAVLGLFQLKTSPTLLSLIIRGR